MSKLTPLSRMVLASICEVNDRKPNLWALIDPGLYGTTRQLDADGFIISGLAGYRITPAGRTALANPTTERD